MVSSAAPLEVEGGKQTGSQAEVVTLQPAVSAGQQPDPAQVLAGAEDIEAAEITHPYDRFGIIGGYQDPRMSYESTYSHGLAGVEGGLGAGLSSLLHSDYQSLPGAASLRDEAELMEFCQMEEEQRRASVQQGVPFKPLAALLPSTAGAMRKRYIPKNRKALERLDEELSAMEARHTQELGHATNFRSQIGFLLKEYQVVMPTITVRYEGVTVQTDALVGSAGIPTVGNAFKTLALSLVGRKPHTVTNTILKDVKGVLLPSRLTLLLGPPSSGKSTMLKVLAGRYQDSKALSVAGSITYNGKSFNEFQVNRTSAFIGQNDVHIPLLSVFDTLMFSYVCQQGLKGDDFNLFLELRKAFEKAKAQSMSRSQAAGLNTMDHTATPDLAATMQPVETPEELKQEILNMGSKVYLSGAKVMGVMRALGILHTKDTPVGDAMVRGVSGGERKRVTVGEMLVGPRRALFMDEISTGLDSATLHNIIKMLGEFTRNFQVTCMVSLLQPPPEVYELFDDLCLLSDAHVVYHGPVQGAVPFFRTLGFVCPPRKDVPSFLQEVTTPSGQVEFATDELLASKGVSRDMDAGFGAPFLVPVEEVVERYWKDTQAGQDMQKLLDNTPSPPPDGPPALVHTRFALAPLEAVWTVAKFQMKLVLKDPVLIKGRLIQIFVIGLLLGGLFFQTSVTLSGARSLLGALFLAIMFTAMGSMPQLAIALSTKPVWYKWRDNQFYAGWAHSWAILLSQFPVAVIDSMAWAIITYFMWGLYPKASYFFTYYLVLLCTNISCAGLFRLIAYIAPDGVAANSYAGLLLLILIVMSGFSIVRGSIPPWWIWAYWISPFAWAMRAVCINEFMSPRWDVPGTAGTGLTLGEEALLSFDFFTERFWIWAGVGFLLGSALFFNVLSGLALQYITPKRVSRVADEEEIAEQRAAAQERKRLAAERAAAEAATAAAAVRERQDACVAAQAATSAVAVAQSMRRAGSVPVQPGTNGAATMSRTGSAPLHAASVCTTLKVRPSGVCATPCQLLAQDAAVINMGKAPTIPFPSVTLVFQDLRYFVPNPAAADAKRATKSKQPGSEVGSAPERLELLKGITGWSTPYSLTALMGGSGAGKTTLMDCVAGRKTVGEITGDITVNGHPKEQRTFARVIGYCEQMDIHTPAQTVREALIFSARLRLPLSVSKETMESYVDEVMEIVELTPLQSDLVGVPGVSGLSVEQRKRLTIGVELVANPSVVFMDEPTSGLDARAAAIVMRAVRNVAKNGRSVMVTIHQPSIEIFETFDSLLLLQRGGRTTYFGSLGKESCDLIAYLQAVPGCPPIHEGQNPSTWMLEVTGGAMSVTAKAVEADWPLMYSTGVLGKANAAKAVRLVADAAAANPVLTVEGGEFAVPFRMQAKMLLWKYSSAYWRTPSYNYTRYIVTVLVAILYGSIYYKAAILPNPAQSKDVQNVMGVLFSSSSFLGMTVMMAAMPIIGLERVVFYRERAASMYSPWAFALALSSVEGPYIVTQVVLFVLILYWMVGFVSTAAKFFWYLLMMLQSVAFYTAFGMAVVSMTPSQQLAQVIAAGVNFLCNVFNGFVIPQPAMAAGFVWINRIVPTTYILYGLASDQLGDDQTPMDYPPDPSITTVAQFMEDVFGFVYNTHWYTPLIILAYILVMRLVFVLALRYISFLRR